MGICYLTWIDSALLAMWPWQGEVTGWGLIEEMLTQALREQAECLGALLVW